MRRRKVTAPRAERGGGGTPVEVALARKASATDDLWSVGSLRSDESVQISTEIAGRIAEILFKEGEEVKAGDVLVKLDDALANAEVADVKSRLDLAQSNFDRAQSLSRSGSGTERALDESTAALETARAALQLAETRLAKLSITAPFPGRVGLRTLSIGAYVVPGTPIVNLEKIDQLKLDFRVPETVLTRVSSDQEVEATVDAYPGRKFAGKVYAIDPQVDVNGRSLRIRARIDNTDLALRPGLFARVIIKGLEERQVVRVPESAVVSRGDDKLVYTIVGGKAKENKVTRRPPPGGRSRNPARHRGRNAGGDLRPDEFEGWLDGRDRRAARCKARGRIRASYPWDFPKSVSGGPSSRPCSASCCC